MEARPGYEPGTRCLQGSRSTYIGATRASKKKGLGVSVAPEEGRRKRRGCCFNFIVPPPVYSVKVYTRKTGCVGPPERAALTLRVKWYCYVGFGVDCMVERVPPSFCWIVGVPENVGGRPG